MLLRGVQVPQSSHGNRSRGSDDPLRLPLHLLELQELATLALKVTQQASQSGELFRAIAVGTVVDLLRVSWAVEVGFQRARIA